jgi:hypothetical protein
MLDIQQRRVKMDRRIKRWVICLAALAVCLGLGSILKGDQPRATDIRLKAKFIVGSIMKGGNVITNKITNDTADYYLSNLTNFIVLRNDPGSDRVGGGFFVLDIVSTTKSSASPFIWLDSPVGPPYDPGPNCTPGGSVNCLSSYCVRPYFIYPNVIYPLKTSRLLFKSGFEFESLGGSGGPTDPVILKQKPNLLNFVTMLDGQTAYVEFNRNWFWPVDSIATKRYNDSTDCFSFGWPYYVKVTAYWDGTGRANRWMVTPINENFKIYKGDDDNHLPIYDEYPDGTILQPIFYFSIRSCHYGRYYFPWELEISREN